MAVRGMEDMRSVFVNVYATDIFSIDISRDMRAFVDDEASFSCICKFTSHRGTGKPGAHNQKIVIHKILDISLITICVIILQDCNNDMPK